MTKLTTAQIYQDRLNKVVSYVHSHLDDDIRIDDLAKVAHMSAYHWHRIYKAMQGETVAATIKRLRLERAADQLANSDMPIKEIANIAHFSTSEAFGRAFKQVYQQAPAAYRNAGSHNAFKRANLLQDGSHFDVVIEPLSVTYCASVEHRGSYMQINHAMGTLLGTLAQHQLLNKDTQMMAVFYDDPDTVEADALRSAACSPIAATVALPAPLTSLSLYQGSYAKLVYQGPYADMKDAYQWLYGTWLPRSGYDAADAPNVELYLNNPAEVAPTELLTQLCLPLQADNV